LRAGTINKIEGKVGFEINLIVQECDNSRIPAGPYCRWNEHKHSFLYPLERGGGSVVIHVYNKISVVIHVQHNSAVCMCVCEECGCYTHCKT
jgi:hypothetical protein